MKTLPTHRRALNSIPDDLIVTQNLVYKHCNFVCSSPFVESESAEYGACIFSLNGKSMRFRVAKIIPKKIGQFVTFWKRTGKSPI